MINEFFNGFDAFLGLKLSVIEASGFHESNSLIDFDGLFFWARTYLADVFLSRLVETFSKINVVLHWLFSNTKFISILLLINANFITRSFETIESKVKLKVYFLFLDSYLFHPNLYLNTFLNIRICSPKSHQISLKIHFSHQTSPYLNPIN